jgi:hypothetical protein
VCVGLVLLTSPFLGFKCQGGYRSQQGLRRDVLLVVAIT